MNRRWLRPALVGGLLLAAGCRLFAPQTSALEDVHEIYRQEFVEFVQTPEPKARPDAQAPPGPRDFSRTLRAIRDFKGKYPGGETPDSMSPPVAHLTVLEGMIYLQSDKLGLAKAVAPLVEKAGARLYAGAGSYSRDALFAKAYSQLVQGYGHILDVKVPGPPDPLHTHFAEVGKGIGDLLGGIKSSALPSSEEDQGALYLATSAAIFYVWAADLTVDKAKKLRYFEAGRDIVKNRLTGTDLAAAEKLESVDGLPSRLRYLAWYKFLKDKADSVR